MESKLLNFGEINNNNNNEIDKHNLIIEKSKEINNLNIIILENNEKIKELGLSNNEVITK